LRGDLADHGEGATADDGAGDDHGPHVVARDQRAATSPNSPPTMKKIVTASEIELSGLSYSLLNAFR